MRPVENIETAYEIARERYARLGVDTDAVLDQMKTISLSVHCWQGDDVGGFERPDSRLEGGGIQITGNFPGKARTIDELRMDLGSGRATGKSWCRDRVEIRDLQVFRHTEMTAKLKKGILTGTRHQGGVTFDILPLITTARDTMSPRQVRQQVKR